MAPPKQPPPPITKEAGLTEVLKRIIDPVQLGEIKALGDDQHVVIPLTHQLLKIPFDREHPLRKCTSLRFRSLEDFIAYVNEQKDADTTRIFYTEGQSHVPPGQRRANPEFSAIIDYHGTAGKPANWTQHEAVLDMAMTEQAAEWFALDGQWIAQVTFAEFLQDHASDVAKPAASEMIKIALELEGSTKGTFSAVQDLHQGNVRISCVSDTTTTITVPREIVVSMPLFVESEPANVTAMFRFRVEGSQPRFCLRFPELARLRREAVKAARLRIAKDTALPVYAAERNLAR